MKRFGVFLFLSLLALWTGPALAYQVQLEQNVPYRSQPGIRAGKDLGRLPPQRLLYLNHGFANDGELWCQVRAGNGATGWIPARYLDPLLRDNIPLRMVDVPGPLIFEHAQQELVFRTHLERKDFKVRLQRSLLEMELAQIKQRWESQRNRLNFLDISRRVGVSVSAQEFNSLKAEMQILEARFQTVVAEWQHLS